MAILLEQRGNYPNKSFKSVATKAWSEFFKLAIDGIDLAHWMIEADSATVRLSGRAGFVDESGPDWEMPKPVVILVDGIIESFETNPHSSDKKLRKHFRQWVEKGILDSFHSLSVTKKFERFNPDSKSFAIVTSQTDLGLAEDELSLMWSNDNSLSVAKIKSRQKTAKSRKRKATVRKKGT